MDIAITNSQPVISVRNQERLIGFARATSDGIYRATIWDVVIHPEYRGTGTGKQTGRNGFESSAHAQS